VAYLAGLPVTKDPSCVLSAPNPALAEVSSFEEVGVDCKLAAPTSGAGVEFRSIVLQPGVPAERYLDGLSRVGGLRVIGGSLPGDANGPYIDVSGSNADGTTYFCRAWHAGQVNRETDVVDIACAGSLDDVIRFWRAQTG
jgi:hypothetical protein